MILILEKILQLCILYLGEERNRHLSRKHSGGYSSRYVDTSVDHLCDRVMWMKEKVGIWFSTVDNVQD